MKIEIELKKIFLFHLVNIFFKGMVDPGEKVSATVKREFMEEAVNALEKSSEERERISNQLEKLFKKGEVVC
jgi:hypothetical protein